MSREAPFGATKKDVESFNSFGLSQEQKQGALEALGGLGGLCESLKTDDRAGLSDAEAASGARIAWFGANRMPAPEEETWSLTGETDDVDKGAETDPFLLSGCALTAGNCFAVVVAVGEESQWGRIKAKLADKPQDTPLQEKLDDLAKLIGYVGLFAAIMTFGAMMALWYLDPRPAAEKGSLRGETMGNATNVCSDKTGTLTQNKMKVARLYAPGSTEAVYTAEGGLTGDGLALDVVVRGAALNSTADLGEPDPAKAKVAPKPGAKDTRDDVVGNKTDGALLLWVRDVGDKSYGDLREALLI
ncbi:calcium-transporting ATPase [Aureococcus anophagefferens]|nr:calcium-transporting ATPase [Aureococcus anophagefferens]